jgi:hypothetical protein
MHASTQGARQDIFVIVDTHQFKEGNLMATNMTKDQFEDNLLLWLREICEKLDALIKAAKNCGRGESA